MNPDTLLPGAIVLSSLVPGLLIFLLKEESTVLRTGLNLLGAFTKLALVAWMMWGVYEGHVYETRLTLAPGLVLVLSADALSVLFVTLSTVLWLVTTVYAIGYLEQSPHRSRFFGFFSLCVSATVGIALAGNLMTFVIFYEVLTLATYPLVAHRGTPDATAGARVYLAYTMVGGALLLTGAVWLQALAGPVTFTRGACWATCRTQLPRAMVVIFFLLLVGLGVKAALVPLHGWLPQAMVAPAPVSALLHAVAVVKAGAFGIVRVVYDVYGVRVRGVGGAPRGARGPGVQSPSSTARCKALTQDGLKKRLAYSTVSQVSYIALGASIFGPVATIGGLVHLVHQGLMKITLFFCAGNYAETLGVHRVSEMDGVGQAHALDHPGLHHRGPGDDRHPADGRVRQQVVPGPGRGGGRAATGSCWSWWRAACSTPPTFSRSCSAPGSSAPPERWPEEHIPAGRLETIAASALAPPDHRGPGPGCGALRRLAHQPPGLGGAHRAARVRAMTWLLAAAWLLPLLLAALAHRERLWWTPALGPVPALAAALLVPIGARLEIPWLLLGSRLGLDETGRLFLAFTAILWLAAGVYAAQSLRDQPHAGRFRAYFLLAMAGNLWLIVAQDLVSFYTGFALMGLASYGLVIHHGDRAALRAGRVYLAMTLVGELALFSALVLIAAQTGTLTPAPEQLTDLSGLTIGLLLFGLAIKAGLVPLHVWLPLAHPAAPVPASAVLSGAMIKVALLGWLRFLPVGEVALPEWGLLLLFAGLITLFFALPIGLVQSDPKVVLAYSSVSKMGFLTLVLGLILLDPGLAAGGVTALILYAAHHALAKGGLFLGVGLRHYGPFQPLVLAGLAVLALSLAGTPASGGAVAKYGLKPVLLGPDWTWLNAAVTLGAVGTTFLMARFLWIMWRIEPHAAKGYVWGGVAWGVLILLVLLYPLVLGSPSAWISGTGPIAIGITIAGLMALVAWRKPRLLGPLVNRVSPGDLLALVRPVLAVLALLGRSLWRGWMGLLDGVQARIQVVLAPLDRRVHDPERHLRAWPNAGGTWLGITAVLLALLLIGRPQGPLLEAAPEVAAVTAKAAGIPLDTEQAARALAAPGSTETPDGVAAETPTTIPAPRP